MAAWSYRSACRDRAFTPAVIFATLTRRSGRGPGTLPLIVFEETRHMVTDVPIISADSHITEPPDTYTARIDARFKDRAPPLVHDPRRGDLLLTDGIDKPIPMGLIAAAGKPAEELTMFGARFEDLHRGGWDPEARLADQARDGVSAEVIYPTVGMMICNHPDFDYKQACFDAYNLWIAEYCAAHPDRLLGIGQTAMRSVEDGIRDLRRIRELGLRGVMLPGNPAVADYHDPIYAPFYEAAIDLALPLSFPIVPSQQDTFRVRGPKLNAFMSIIRGCQDLVGTFVLGGVFERHPRLRLVCVEADAGWVPHFMYRMDHAYDRHRYWLPSGTLTHLPGRLCRLPGEGPLQHPPAPLGQRLPAQRLDVAALAGAPRQARLPPEPGGAAPDPPRQRGRALRPGGSLSDGLRSRHPGRHDRRRHRTSGGARRRGDPGRPDRRGGRGEGRRRADGRRGRARGRARLHRRPHPLRRAGDVGPDAHDLTLARGDHGRDGQLRLRRGADAPGPSRAHHAHARGGRGYEPRRARGGPRREVAVRDLPRVCRRGRAARHRAERGGAPGPHPAAALRHGRGGDRAAGDG